MVVTIHNNLLTQWRHIPMGQFCVNIFLIETTFNYLRVTEDHFESFRPCTPYYGFLQLERKDVRIYNSNCMVCTVLRVQKGPLLYCNLPNFNIIPDQYISIWLEPSKVKQISQRRHPYLWVLNKIRLVIIFMIPQYI